MSQSNKRQSDRRSVQLTTYVRKELPGGGYTLMQFVSKDLSEGGVFISAEDLSLFDLGERISVMVDRSRERIFEGQAIVVRSARVFESGATIPESGYGLMFSGDDNEFSEMVKDQLAGLA
jgi:hypothetical protein